MPSLTIKKISGRNYYYLRECKRVDGKPKIVWQQYLGTAADLVARLTDQPATPHEASVREFGASAACVDIARQLDIVGIIDRHVPKRSGHGVSVGEYILIAALNRCLAPKSKAKIAEWFDQTVLPRLLGVNAAQLSSQRFWDNMSRVDEDAITRIERDLSKAVVSSFDLDLRCLLFDATNFFTFVDSFNLRPKLPQRGHSKEGRANLRIVGLALLVTADGEVPLMHHCYAGNQHDAKTFGSVATTIARRCRELTDGANDITLVFDKGNNSEDNLKLVAKAKLHFVGSLVPTQHKELLAIRREQMRRLDKAVLPAVWSYRTKKQLYGVERTVLVTFNRPLFTAQVKTLTREINKRRRKFEQLEASLKQSAKKRGGKKPTIEGTRNRVKAILAGRHMKDLFVESVKLTVTKRLKLTWRFKPAAFEELKATLLGKTILFTDRSEWTDEQIVRGYRSQSHVEAAFRSMKDTHCLTFRPIHHWTDQKMRVHALYCVIALTMLSVLRRKLAHAEVSVSASRMIEQLSQVKEVTLVHSDADGTPARVQTLLSKLKAQQHEILRVLGISRFLPT